MAWDSNQRHNDKLKFNKLIFSVLILLTPLTAWASGQYLIPTLLINGVVIVLIGSSILGLKIRGLGKLILFGKNKILLRENLISQFIKPNNL